MLRDQWSAAEGGDRVADPDRLYTRTLREDLEEARDKLLKLKKMNELLEGENQDLRRRLLSQMVNYPDAAETRELARRHGPELAHAFSSLTDENKYLKVKLQSCQRAEVRAEIRAEQLADTLRSNEEKRYAFGLARDAARGSASGKVAMLEAGGLGSRARRDIGDSLMFRSEDVPGPVAVLRDGKHLRLRADANEHCLCTEKLQELMDSLDDNLKSYERNVWQLQVNVLEDERSELQMKVANLSERLSEIQSKIMNDPFLSAKYAAAGTPGAVPNAQTQLREASARLALAESVNAELERRLAFERSISRSWQTNLRAMQRELREHLASLALASRKSGMSCDLFRGGILQAAETAARRDVAGVPGCERESLRLLRQAADRIDSDAKRLEVYSSRIAELEREVKDLRVRLHEALSQKAVARVASLGHLDTSDDSSSESDES
ncbi:UNVERIFIED_CONTAM: cyclic nucleotide-binding domain protein [Hammondia hammondi]|eukprot:XP_008889382.1 cyclic nucleotide-binding domain protein [Hammondia hammondi]